jgi:hypothetical protein
MVKKYYLPAEEIRPLAMNRGACIASDLIVVGGARVGYMYREEPDNDVDSGWRFFAGTESQEYADDATNFAFYDINTVANYDPEIVPLLGAESGSAFARDESGAFVPVAFPADPDDN